MPVISNWDAATHKGAVKRCQGYRQIYSPFQCFTTWGATNCHFLLGKGAAKFFKVPEGALNQKKVEK